MSKNAIAICPTCKNEFPIEKHRLKDGKPKYCSSICWYTKPSIKSKFPGRDLTKVVNCDYCNKEFHPWTVSESRGHGHFCSKSCVTATRNKAIAKTPIEIFYKNAMIPNNKNECWIWKKQKSGRYGTMTINGVKSIGAHRFSYEHFNGEIPEGMFICHHCDQPKCVNPKHLFLGTPQDNVDDKMRKGRFKCAIGEQQGNSILTEDQVKEIKLKLKEGIYQRIIAKEYNIAQSAISKINKGIYWKHVTI